MRTRISLALCAALLLLSLLPGAALAQTGAACARDVTVTAGDTLTGLANTYLDDPLAYNRIIAATNAAAAADDSFATINDEGRIVIGWKLCIPGAAAAARVSAAEGGGPASSSGTGVTMNAAGTVAPSDVFTFDGEKLTIDYLRKQKYPGSDIVVEQTLDPGVNYDRYVVSYRSEGLKQYALLTVPQGQRPSTGWPAIIFNHGYIPPEVYRTTERYVAYVDGFARNGYVVFRPDYRGHGFSEGEARGAYGNPDYTVDVLNGLASVKRLDYVDPNRIGMWGHSMGGYITLRAMVTDPSIKAGVIWAGVVASYQDLVERWNTQRSLSDAAPAARRWRAQLLDEYGTPEENPAYWASISANSYLKDLSGPVQIHHGTNDAEVPTEFSLKLFDQIKVAGQTAEIYTYLGDDHNISQSLNTAIQRSVAFFDKYVKNG
ncbi:MAG: alpha/beta fold hydrolase [Caldilineaceae bacterium]